MSTKDEAMTVSPNGQQTDVSGNVYILIDGLGDNLAYIIKDEKELEHWKSDGSIVKGDKLYKAVFVEQF